MWCDGDGVGGGVLDDRADLTRGGWVTHYVSIYIPVQYIDPHLVMDIVDAPPAAAVTMRLLHRRAFAVYATRMIVSARGPHNTGTRVTREDVILQWPA